MPAAQTPAPPIAAPARNERRENRLPSLRRESVATRPPPRCERGPLRKLLGGTAARVSFSRPRATEPVRGFASISSRAEPPGLGSARQLQHRPWSGGAWAVRRETPIEDQFGTSCPSGFRSSERRSTLRPVHARERNVSDRLPTSARTLDPRSAQVPVKIRRCTIMMPLVIARIGSSRGSLRQATSGDVR